MTDDRVIPDRMACPICSEVRCSALKFGKLQGKDDRRWVKITCQMCGCEYVATSAGVVETN